LGPLGLIPGVKDAFNGLLGVKGYASVVTTDGEDQSAGWHCGWKGTMTHINLNCVEISVPDFGCTDEGGHPWQGITPYMSFASDPEFARGQPQPDVWVAIEAPRSAASGKVGGSAIDVEVNTPTGLAAARTADVGDRIVDGMAAVSRATAYYHRPGNWHEH